MNIKKQIKKLYFFQTVNALNIADSVWVLFLLSRGFTLMEIGLAEGFFHLVSFLCEVPSGMAADLLGRKRAMAASCISSLLSALLMALSTNFAGVCASMGFCALGYNLLSGTLEALTYDSLLIAGQADQYIKVSSVQNTIYRIVQAISGLSSVIAVALGYMKVYLVSALLAMASAAIAYSLTEPLATKAQKHRQQNPFDDLFGRLRRQIRMSKDFLIHQPRILWVMAADCSVACVTYLTYMLLQEHLVTAGVPRAIIGLPLLLIQLAGAIGVILAPRLKARFFKISLGCAAGAGLGTLSAGSNILPIILAGASFAQAADGIIDLHTDNHLNQKFPSDQRATLVSINSILYSCMMIIASPIAGWVCNLWSVTTGLAVLGITLILSTCVCGIIYVIHGKQKQNRK
ncbi:MAG: MFS transporter [Oscillospiraceae bacterium]|jgi:MFS family permease|nr:MFS transporter [Oscillospiraceae bacterium]